MSTTKAGGRSKAGLPDEYWRKAYDMRGVELDRLRSILAHAVVWLDGDDSAAWMVDARNAIIDVALDDFARHKGLGPS